MNLSDRGLALIKEFESLRLDAYQDSVGVWTVGWGHTGKDVTKDTTISEATAELLIREDVSHAERCVSRFTAGLSPLTQGQFDALVSFAFNVGCDALHRSTLLNKLLDGDRDGAADEFQKWNKAGGKTLAGLTRRRAAEAELFRA